MEVDKKVVQYFFSVFFLGYPRFGFTKEFPSSLPAGRQREEVWGDGERFWVEAPAE